MNCSIKKILYEGKAKILYYSSDPYYLIQHFKIQDFNKIKESHNSDVDKEFKCAQMLCKKGGS